MPHARAAAFGGSKRGDVVTPWSHGIDEAAGAYQCRRPARAYREHDLLIARVSHPCKMS